jgi:hypothetical protein
MRGIRAAINQLPSWPGFVLGAIAIVGIGTWYYSTTYFKCSEVRQGRTDLHSALVAAAASSDAVLDLTSAVPGDWDEVRIVQGHRPAQDPLNCPFGWDMTWHERNKLITAGNYTIIGFFESGKFRRYIEYRGDWARFAEPPKSIPRSSARFAIAQPENSNAPYILTLKP